MGRSSARRAARAGLAALVAPLVGCGPRMTECPAPPVASTVPAVAPSTACGPVPSGVTLDPAPLVEGAPGFRASAGAVEQLALCAADGWRLVDLEPRQLSDGEGFEVRITGAELADRTGDGAPELEVTYAFVESLTALPPTGPYRRGEGRALVAPEDGAVLLRVHLGGMTDTAVAYDTRRMVGAAQWVTLPGGPPVLDVVQSVAVTEDEADAEGESEHGRPVTRFERFDATATWDGEGGRFVVDGTLWTVWIPGL